jgi:hypothetical protein
MKGGTTSRLPISRNVSRGYLSMVELRLTGRYGEVGKGGKVGALGSNAQGNHALRPDDSHHLDDMRLLRELMQVTL